MSCLLRVVLCCALLCCAVLCCAVLRCVTLAMGKSVNQSDVPRFALRPASVGAGHLLLAGTKAMASVLI